MLYTDIGFLYLFAAVCGVTFLLRPWPALKEWFLIVFSLLVIATWGWYDLALFLGVLAVNFVSARLLPRLSPPAAKRLLIGTIGLDLATLALFKYANFLGTTLAAISPLEFPSFPLGIPLAISFYVFHLISYLVDIHAGRVRVATFRQYLFYLSFFPHVIAGPIVRAWQLVPQIGVTRRVRNDLFMGFHFVVVGVFLKCVGANNIAQAIDPYWADGGTPPPFDLTCLEHWLVAFLYYCQIYGDFAGYSLMALGMARMLGYRLPPNFRTPMLAASLREFWQRWHITLSRWIRDYLYIPLGGNRCSAPRAAFNLLFAFFLCGLWHGAGWGFALWGLMHGAGLVAERFFHRDGMAASPSFRWGGWAAAQLWVVFAWVFFRCPSLAQAWDFARPMLTLAPAFHPPHPFWFVRNRPLLALLPALAIVAHHGAPFFLKRVGRRRLGLALGIVTGVLFVLNCIVYSPAKGFIYFLF
ncbi:D-alanyl-lipoteichoic acid acyltransferase DltB, MBOAT superfamily [Verrucomicrobium sp. GAS474]|uniref:MBOAT family O-acyltransferase n=1 Tax=Verrucomicrobium sp. GAS474 TaxID=1882831 RepID=UPI00087A1C7F|nr:MBOAT family O-acyltransferase [Verrucomicrobium sp. GAS474]SDU04291.1 D-alanyl-lipoteichoic acid acyltransferase DltB, MBOAT superfamily [Verrucomicrobium sp. GAS474]